MGILASATIGQGTTTATGSPAISTFTIGPVNSGERVVIAVAAGANQKVVAPVTDDSGQGITWSIIDTKASNNAKGAVSLLVSSAFNPTVATLHVTATFSGTNSHVIYIARTYTGIGATSPIYPAFLDQINDGAVGSTANGLVSTQTLAVINVAVFADEIVLCATFVDEKLDPTFHSYVADDSYTVESQIESTIGTLVLQEKILTVSETSTNTLSWGNTGADGAITSGTAVFTSASASFNSGNDNGKNITVAGAGVAGAALLTTISSVTNATTATLAANASTTVSNATYTYGIGRAAGIMACLEGSVNAPNAGASVATDEVLWGTGLNFADDSFLDRFATLESSTQWAYSPVPDPTVALTLGQTTGGSLTLLGTYYLAYSWEDSTIQNGSFPTETLISPVVSITLTGSNDSITVTPPTPPAGIQPSKVDTLNIYMSTSTFVSGGGAQQVSVTPYPGTTQTITSYNSSGTKSQKTNAFDRQGGFGRNFVASRANYASDSTLYPSIFGSMVNNFIVSAYANGCTTSYQNGHPKNPLMGCDIDYTLVQPAWVGGTTYAINAIVSYQIGGPGNPTFAFQSVAGSNVGNTPSLGSQNTGNSHWTCIGTYAPNFDAGVTYSLGDCSVYKAIRYKSLKNANTGNTPSQGQFGLGDGVNWAPFGTFWNTVILGAYDVAFLTFFNQIYSATDSHGTKFWRADLPFIYSPSHEFSNGGDTTPNGPSAGTQDRYAPFFQHVYNLLFATTNKSIGGWAGSGPGIDMHISVGGPIALALMPDANQVMGDPTLPANPHVTTTTTQTITWPLTGSLGVVDCSAFPNAGGYAVIDGYTINYNAVSTTPGANQLLGCITTASGSSGTTASGALVTANLFSIANAAYIVSNCDPGTSYYDFAGVDMYSHRGTTTQTAQNQYAPAQAWAVSRGKSMIVTETGCDAAHGDVFCCNYWTGCVSGATVNGTFGGPLTAITTLGSLTGYPSSGQVVIGNYLIQYSAWTGTTMTVTSSTLPIGASLTNGATIIWIMNPPSPTSVQGYARAWGGGTGVGNLHMFCPTSRIAGGGDYRMNASLAIYQSFAQMSEDPTFGGLASTLYKGTGNAIHLL